MYCNFKSYSFVLLLSTLLAFSCEEVDKSTYSEKGFEELVENLELTQIKGDITLYFFEQDVLVTVAGQPLSFVLQTRYSRNKEKISIKDGELFYQDQVVIVRTPKDELYILGLRVGTDPLDGSEKIEITSSKSNPLDAKFVLSSANTIDGYGLAIHRVELPDITYEELNAFVRPLDYMMDFREKMNEALKKKQMVNP